MSLEEEQKNEVKNTNVDETHQDPSVGLTEL